VNAFVYYGISFNIGEFGGDLFVNFALAGLVEVPSYLFTIYAFDYVGRRTLTAILMLFGGVSCLGIILSKTLLQSATAIIVSAMLGKFAITSTFAIIYVYSAELYPTALRQFAVGSCSIAGRVGSILAPFIKELVSNNCLF
jgi:OCT family organic cation transporter-like MFS transporter 4/5